MLTRPTAFVLAATTAIFALAGCTAKTSPSQQAVSPDRNNSVKPDAAATVAPAKTLGAPIVMLQGREHTITIYSSAGGPLFTVATSDGKVLADRLNADGIRQQLPEIYEAYESSFAGGGRLDAGVGHEAAVH